MEKMKMQTPDLSHENIRKIAELFPNCVTEAENNLRESAPSADQNIRLKVDFDLLRQELSADVVEGPAERYSLNWPGKREAIATANAPINKTLRPCREESVDFDTTENLYIEGDNLDALKLLQETYLGKVKMIYIDPPYNTGNDFIYDDNFTVEKDEYDLLSEQKDEEGGRLVANTDSNGRFHSDWLSMIYPRLKLSRNLLAADGVICVSISDTELKNLRSVMDQVFGEQNYINTISVLAKVSAGASGGGEDKRLKKNLEYILVYAKSFLEFNTLAHLYTNQPLMQVIEEMRDAGESWKYTSILLGADERVFFKEVEDGDGNPIEIYKRSGVRRTTINKVCKNEGISEEDAYERYFDGIFSDTNAQTSIRERVIDAVGNLDQDEILEVEYVPRSGKEKGLKVCHTYISNTVRRVIWLKNVAEKTGSGVIKKEKLGTFWENFDYNNVGKEGALPFPDGKKPIDLIRTCINLYNKKDGVFLDFFAGSGSFCHAVMRQNAGDAGLRKFIAVQIPEKINPKNKKYQNSIKVYEQNDIPLVITEISKERIRRAGMKIVEEMEAKRKAKAKELDLLSDQSAVGNQQSSMPDIGFRVLKIASSNMKDVWYTPDEIKQEDLELFTDPIKEGRTPEDLLFQVMLDWGSPTLDAKIRTESIGGKNVFIVNENDILACFDTEITEEAVKEMAAHKPLRAVFRDDAFDDSLKINVEQIFKVLSPGTEVKSI